ncbi:MAG TPA: glycosyltransferase family 4 protein [Candidatus Saccharimonadales bacterium]|nr:glycosyltransferase family 4 protein [Candidatus Saccharimonadales bacterium]
MPKVLKVGMVFDDSLDKPDGVQQYVLVLGRWLERQGHEVHYLVGETKRTDLPRLHSLSRNLKVRFNQNRMAMPLPAQAAGIRALLASEHFDVLHVQVPYSPFLAGKIITRVAPRTAVVGTFHVAPHSGLVTFANRCLRLAVTRSFRRFDAMIAAPAAADFAKKTFGVDSERIPLPLELDQFYHASAFPKYAKGHTVVFLGRLVERKGCAQLLQAVAHARQSGIWPVDTRVIICGGGPLEQRLKAYTQEYGLVGTVSFEGYISEADKPRYLASADVAVYPSTGGESFGVVILEAMAAARGIVLAGNNPGYGSILGERPDQLFDPYDVPGLAGKIAAALQNKALRHEARAWQRQYVRQFNTDQVGPQIIAVYNRALRKREQ